MLSISDVNKIDARRKQIRKEIYTKIYDQFVAKIRQSVELGCKQIFLQVPSFLVGYPTFDRQQAETDVATTDLQPTGLENEFKTVPGVQAPSMELDEPTPEEYQDQPAPPAAPENDVLFGDAPERRIKNPRYN